MVTQVPFQCRSPYLKDYREARDQLTHQQLILVDYAFLPPDDLPHQCKIKALQSQNSHTNGNNEYNVKCREKLFEYANEEEDTKLWIFREAFETLAGKDQDLDKSIVDLAIENEQGDLSNNFKAVMELERRRYKWMKLGEAQLVLFPILQDHHFFVLCYDFATKKIIILDNRLEGQDCTSRYKRSAMAMVKIP
ncbi:hypothetical protein Cgig2_009984 [Carnegiea gigantea]|uniref:Ubiquitin-like protease family profile domain-containing protein n=1 Tax=Carnegiea gigantea TaxID=171969 RepID=A0A9Q1JWM8_9CARY|nr:hypothetical protein Cgig2_009984 [Carnegiea gigantea]